MPIKEKGAGATLYSVDTDGKRGSGTGIGGDTGRGRASATVGGAAQPQSSAVRQSPRTAPRHSGHRPAEAGGGAAASIGRRDNTGTNGETVWEIPTLMCPGHMP